MNKRDPSTLPAEFGNLENLDANGTGWIIGFSDWCKQRPHDLRHMAEDRISRGVCVKWFSHVAGDPDGQEKPISTGRTMSILVTDLSEFKLDFCFDPRFESDSTLSHTLRCVGDYAIWGPGIFHRAFGLKSATIMTVRWEPESSDEHNN